MRSHAKASTAGSTQCQAGIARLGFTRLICLAAVSLLALLVGATPAFAATVTERPLLFRTDGSDTTAGAFGALEGGMAVDESTGTVYVADPEKNVIDKFNANGEAQNFSATGTSSLTGNDTPQGELGLYIGGAPIAVDDSGVNPGRIYVGGLVPVVGAARYVNAFSPAGEFLWQLPIPDNACGLAVDTAGHLWVAGGNTVREFAATGSPPVQLSSFAVSQPTFRCALDVSAGGAVYLLRQNSETGRHDAVKYVGGVLSSVIELGTDDATTKSGITVDQSSPAGHIFALRLENFNEYDSSDTLLGNFGTNTIYFALAIGYNPNLDHVYVAERPGRLSAFGPETTGTAPDTTTEAASEIGVSKAKLNGKVNPQSVPNAYYFEWVIGTANEDWGKAKSSTPQALPEDSSDHAVALNVTQLAGNTTYQARLVGVNTENHLRTVSSAITFTTPTVAAVPVATVDAPSSVTATTAEITGAVNPVEDFGTTWRLQLSTDPACASGFVDQPSHDLESEANSPVAVSEELTDLLPNQHYCVRISATNSLGSTTSEVKEFSTDPVLPTEAFTAFAAPRTDTTARINGRVNPHGANSVNPLIYRFEYSKDGGSTWITLPDREYTGAAREQIVLSDDLTGLTPSTTYSYRFSAENVVGEASPQGGVESFTTRATAEMNPAPRGLELVSAPDKGNQRALPLGLPTRGTSPMSADGEKVVWSVLGGAPGGTSSTGATFLARRTSTGWKSTSLVPPASEQIGGGDFRYRLEAIATDFSKFIFGVALSKVVGEPDEPVFVRLDDSHHQEVLRAYSEAEFKPPGPEISDDAAHVLIRNPTSQQLEDIGGGATEIISVMPEGSLVECPGGVGQSNFSVVASNPGYRVMASTDASRVYFQARPNDDCSAPRGLYVRNRESEETILVDPGVPGAQESDPEFIRATRDGRGAYFATASQLDPADANANGDVYRWDEESGESTCLTCDASADAAVLFGSGSTASKDVLVSDDYSHIYFESKKQLVPGLGAEGENNLYVMSEGAIRFVANPNKPAALLFPTVSKLSADGDVLLFVAKARPGLTSDPVAPTCFHPSSGGSFMGDCLQLYRYDDRDGGIECLSCRKGGVTSHSLGVEDGLSGIDHQQSADGGTVAFSTWEPLVPLDVNHEGDIYVWRNGALRLVTDGISEQSSSLSSPMILSVSDDGEDILLGLAPRGKLTGFERDGLLNLYDARIGGGFEPPSPPVHCAEDSCQGPLEPDPPVVLPSSSTFSGRGNVPRQARKRRPCASKRGKAKRRCVRKQKRRANKARAHRKTGRVK